MTRLANTTLKGMTIAEVKTLLKKERNIAKSEWHKAMADTDTYVVEYAFDKYLFCDVDANKVVINVERVTM